MNSSTYKRGQIEWALWRNYTLASAVPFAEPTTIFRTRIKRLLDVDRSLENINIKLPSGSPHAFGANDPGGRGVETQYTSSDVFSLAIGLDLLHIGFKQSEVVFLIRQLRDVFDDLFLQLLAPPPPIDFALLSASPTVSPKSLPEDRVFLILTGVELTDVSPPCWSPADDDFLSLNVQFCRGSSELMEFLDLTIRRHWRTVVILEIASTARALKWFLAEAPPIPRGRPRQAG